MSARDIQYTLFMEAPHTHLIDVQIEINGLDGEFLDLSMPVWTPGSYLVREYSKNIMKVSAYHKKSQLTVSKTDKNTWRIFLDKHKKITVEYQVYAFEMTVRTSFMDEDFAMLNGASIFLIPDGYDDTQLIVDIEPYYKWEKTTTELPKYKGSYNKFISEDFDQLVDSPIIIGNHDTFKFSASGVQHIYAITDTGNFDMDKIIPDTQKIVETANSIFNDVPYDHYTFFLNTADGAYGGLEHKNSCSLIFDRWKFKDRKDYLKFMGLVSHEFFHVYNVKRIRPIELGPFDYDNENYTTLLWVSEGLNSYYDNYLLRRSDIATVDEYLGFIANDLKRLDSLPGRKVQSVSESSFDAWIKLYRSNENSMNSTISYYLKGSLIGWVLDLRIRHATDGKRSLDDVFRELWLDYRNNGKGFTEENVIDYSNRISGENLSDIWEYIHSTKEIDYERYLRPFGLKLEKSYKDDEKQDEAWFGLTVNKAMKITKISSESPAYQDGLNVNDEIISLNGFRLASDDYKNHLARMDKGHPAEFLVSRRGIIRTVKVTPGDQPFDKYEILQVDDASEAAKSLYENWLFTKWESKDK